MSTLLLKHTNPVLDFMHGNSTEEDFQPEMLAKMKRLMNHLMLGSDDARDFYRIAAMITDSKHGDANPIFNEIVILNALYQMGVEEGKRIERKKGSH